MKEIYRNHRYLVVAHEGATPDNVVVVFTTWRAEQSLDLPVFGEAYLQKLGLSYLAVRAACNDWFQGPIDGALAALRDAIGGRTAIAYGSSMGAYASINFAVDLGLKRSACFVPQFSVDAVKAPFEKRWRAEAAALDFHIDKIGLCAGHKTVVVYDPTHTSDARHVARISAFHSVTHIRLPGAGHNVGQYLKAAGTLGLVSRTLLTHGDAMPAEIESMAVPLRSCSPGSAPTIITDMR